jgi:diguanylate cyclase (GGDEF)-like protein
MDEARQLQSSRKVLIIEDDRTVGAIIEEMLTSNGYAARLAGTGAEGIEAAREWPPDVVLLDLMLPDMDGLEVCDSLRRLGLAGRLPVIIVSGTGDKKTIAGALSKGADDFVVKPVDELELVERVGAQLRISGFYRELWEDKRNLETILDITQAVSATLDSSEVLDIIVEKVADITGAVRCSVVLVSGGEGYVLASHDNLVAKNMKIDLEKYPEIRKVIDTKHPVTLKDMKKHPLMDEVRDRITDLEGMSLLVVPIVFQDEVLGTLFLRARRAQDGFSKKEIDFCRIVANSSYHAMKNARLYEEVKGEKERLRELSITDQLTDLYNHSFFTLMLDEEFEKALRYETPLSLLMLYVDNFRHINRAYGHTKGDKVLKETAGLIKGAVRKCDMVAHYGGGVFAVILPQTPLVGAAVEEAERIRALVEAHRYADLDDEVITLSIGVASYPDKKVVNSGDLVNLADGALGEAKRERNSVKVGGGESGGSNKAPPFRPVPPGGAGGGESLIANSELNPGFMSRESGHFPDFRVQRPDSTREFNFRIQIRD